MVRRAETAERARRSRLLELLADFGHEGGSDHRHLAIERKMREFFPVGLQELMTPKIAP